MKRNTFLLFILGFAISTSLLAQAVKKTETIKEEEVPVAVRLAFKEDFGEIPADGTWSVNFAIVSEGTRSVARPTWYTFKKGSRHEKIEVRYTPDGKLESFKGLKKTSDNS